jgi:lysophospholipase L1-like esterase
MKMNMGKKLATFWSLIMTATVALSAERVVEADLHQEVTDAFINPDQASSLPRVLIIGDSISIGYTDPVRNDLKGIAEVFRPPVNCQHSGYGVEHINAWIGTGKWDVIHFNFGIWDTHLLDSKGQLVSGGLEGNTNLRAKGIRIRYTPEQYQQNLAQIIEILKRTGAPLIWASTTPIMFRTGARLEVIPAYNRVAADLMKTEGIAIDDLYSFVLPQVKEWQTPDQCHFNALGNKHLGKQVSESIRRAIEKNTPSPSTKKP